MTDVNLSFYGGNIMAEKEIRNFALQDEKGNKIEVFMGRSLRQAALKAAQARGCRWTSPRVRRPGCPTRSGSPWSRKWVSRSWKRFEASR
jgi:hypothetical protein